MSEEATQTASTEPTEPTVITGEGAEQSMTSYLDGKYDSVSSLETGYKELQSSYSKKTAEYKEQLGAFSGTPEGDYELKEGFETSDAVMKFARDNQFSNDALNGLIEAHNVAETQEQEAFIAEQKGLLGNDAEARITNVVDWARATFGEDALTTINEMATTAAGIEIFEKMSKMNNGTSPAQVLTPKAVVDRDTVKSMRFATDEQGNRRMSSDPQYRAKVEAMEAEFLSSGGKF